MLKSRVPRISGRSGSQVMHLLPVYDTAQLRCRYIRIVREYLVYSAFLHTWIGTLGKGGV